MKSEFLALAGKELHKNSQTPEPTDFLSLDPLGLGSLALLEIQLPQNGIEREVLMGWQEVKTDVPFSRVTGQVLELVDCDPEAGVGHYGAVAVSLGQGQTLGFKPLHHLY